MDRIAKSTLVIAVICRRNPGDNVACRSAMDREERKLLPDLRLEGGHRPVPRSLGRSLPLSPVAEALQ